MTSFAFFLGGQDLEMVTIADLLHHRQQAGDTRIAAIFDRKLPWGAKASSYQAEIVAAADRRQTPALIELQLDMPLPPGSIDIDHHGARATEPSALRQVFDLLALPATDWTRHFALVDANDRGHVAALREMGASTDEIAQIRAADRAAQGITPEEEAAGLVSLQHLRQALKGTLLIADLPSGKSATLTDPLVLMGETRDLLILSARNTQFFGSGVRIRRLDVAFPGGWRGGRLPLGGYWGIDRRLAEAELLVALA